MTERERLVKLITQKGDAFDERFGIEVGRLADYLLANGIVVPPCKAGDTVYILRGKKIVSAFVLRIFQDMDDNGIWFVRVQMVKDCWDMEHLMFDDFGKTVFKTCTEAKRVLKVKG